MSDKYSALRHRLEDAVPGEELELMLVEVDELVGGLPPSASTRAWWANAHKHSQSRAWLAAGWKVERVDFGRGAVIFVESPQGLQEDDPRPTGAKPAPLIDGVASLAAVLARAGYLSTVHAIAEHTLFLHPDTVAQTRGEAVFPVVRVSKPEDRRGAIGFLPDGQRVLFDDNTTPARAFLWASGRSAGVDVQFNHVWTDSRNPHTYTALWNLCATPAFLAKTTDGSKHADVVAALRRRVRELFGCWPAGEPEPIAPPGYDDLAWADPLPAVDDLEAAYRARMIAAPKSRPALAARSIGWFFSEGKPDTELPAGDSTT